jgi:hypothetical protein
MTPQELALIVDEDAEKTAGPDKFLFDAALVIPAPVCSRIVNPRRLKPS